MQEKKRQVLQWIAQEKGAGWRGEEMYVLQNASPPNRQKGRASIGLRKGWTSLRSSQ